MESARNLASTDACIAKIVAQTMESVPLATVAKESVSSVTMKPVFAARVTKSFVESRLA